MSTTSKHPRDEDASAAEASAKVAKGDSGNDSPTPSSSLATFWDLPFELRSVIFELAYKEQEKGIHGTRLPRLERKTLLSLTLVSRQFHSTFSQLLYAHVQLTKPSVLADFHRALVLRPSNALLVKSLHMGQLTGLAQGWWPVRWMRDPVSQHESYYTDEPLAYFKTSWSKDDEAVRPRWCKPGQDWVNDREDVYNPLGYPCHEKAVMDAISAALKGWGVSLYADHFDEYETTDGNREFLEINKWVIGVFEAQAILDLYLAEMRRIEDAEGRVVPSWRDKTESSTLRIPTNCRVRRCGHYPRLVLEGFDCRNKDKAKQRSAYTRRRPRMDSASGYWTDEGDAYSDEEDEWTDEDEEDSEDGEGERKTFTITLEQVNTHLARRGTSHDHLDHPLLVARSGLQALTMSRGGVPLVVHGDYPDEERAGFYDWDDPTDDDDSEHEGRHLRYAEEDDYLSEAERAELFPPRPSPPPLSPSTAGLPNGPLDPKRRSDIITLGRSVIHLARNLQNLSLTGYMYRCAHRKPHGLQNLRSLCLGPLTPSEQAAQCLAKVKLPSLRRLRVCGGNLCAVAAEVIGSPGGKLPQLRDVEWDYGALRLTHRRGYQRGQFLEAIFRLLQGWPPVEETEDMSAADYLVSSTIRKGSSSRHVTSQEEVASSSYPARYIEARLHPDVISEVLERAPTPAVRAAWLEGSVVAGALNRVRIVQSRAARTHNQGSESQYQDMKVVWKESEAWWEERALESGLLPAVTV